MFPKIHFRQVPLFPEILLHIPLTPQKYSLMFPKIAITFQLLMVSYFHKFYLAYHSRDNPQQNALFVSLINVALPQVHQQKFMLLRTVRVRTSLVCWVLSWSRISSSSLSRFQNILIMLVDVEIQIMPFTLISFFLSLPQCIFRKSLILA